MYGSYLLFGHFANFHFYYYFRMWLLHYYLPPLLMLRFIYLMNKTRITQMCYAVLINAGLLVISELFSKTFHDQHWRILPKVFLALTFMSLFGLAVFNGVFFYSTWAEFGRSLLSSLIIAIPALIAFYVYHKYRFDFINLIVSVLALLGAYAFWLLL